jgi:hypothetical protein
MAIQGEELVGNGIIVPKKPFFHKKSGIMFAWSDDVACYEPIAYSGVVTEDGIQAIDIVPGDLIYDFIMFIRHSSVEINTVTGEITSGMLDIYQWIMGIEMLQAIRNMQSDEYMGAISRQAK